MIKNNLDIRNYNIYNSIGVGPSQNQNNEPPSLLEKKKARRLSQQYCADFKKMYCSGNKSY